MEGSSASESPSMDDAEEGRHSKRSTTCVPGLKGSQALPHPQKLRDPTSDLSHTWTRERKRKKKNAH